MLKVLKVLELIRDQREPTSTANEPGPVKVGTVGTGSNLPVYVENVLHRNVSANIRVLGQVAVFPSNSGSPETSHLSGFLIGVSEGPPGDRTRCSCLKVLRAKTAALLS